MWRLRKPRFRQAEFVLLAILLLGGCSLLAAEEQQVPRATLDSPTSVTDVASLRAELRRISANLDKAASAEQVRAWRNALPEQWSIKTPEGRYSISTDYLRRQLSDRSVTNAKVWVDYLQGKLSTYSDGGSVDLASSRAQLERILAGPEFAAVHPPTAWDLFRGRLALWMARLFERIFGGLCRYPIGGETLFWLALVAGVAFLAVTVFRFMVGRERVDSFKSNHIFGVSRTWQEWVRIARDAAARNEFRDAVHAAYWAGITRLEDTGVLPKDCSRTPREYLKLLSQPAAPEQPGGLAFREPLSILTRRLEQTWYGKRDAALDDFRDSLQQLELLGCQLE